MKGFFFILVIVIGIRGIELVKVEFDTIEKALEWYNKLENKSIDFLDEKQYLVSVELLFRERD